MRIDKCSQFQFENSVTGFPEDRFEKTFLSKAKTYGDRIWENCYGAYSEDDELLGAISYTISKRSPKVMNLQLLHVFSNHRRKGIAKALCEYILGKEFSKKEAVYFRVSSEVSAIKFYEKLGIRFIGRQKSGCLLSMSKLDSPNYSNLSYNINDPVIKKAISGNRRGACVEIF